MKRSKGRIYLSAFLAVVVLVFGYVGWRYVSYTQALKKAQEQYVLPASCSGEYSEPETLYSTRASSLSTMNP